MKFIKFFSFILAILLSISQVNAEEAKMKIKQSDGTVTELKLVSEMTGIYSSEGGDLNQMWFTIYTGTLKFDENGKLEGVDNGEIHFQAPLEKMRAVFFSGLSGVEETIASDVIISLVDSRITLTSPEKPIEVQVTNASGITVLHNVYSTDTEIDLHDFGKGIYMIKIGNNSYKMLVK